MKDLYFIDSVTRLIFGLVELEGESQMKFLGITMSYYTNKKLAKKWYEETLGKIKDSNHPMVEVAMENLKKLYKGMK